MTSAPSSTLDRGRARRRGPRLLQLVGLIVASVGLAGIWLDRGVPRTELSEFQRQLLGVEEGTEVLSFVLAGRDRVYFPDLSTMLRRVRDLNVRAVAVLPDLLDVFFADVETNASPTLVRELLPRLARFELRSATLPSYEREGSSAAFFDRRVAEAFLAATFGGVAPAWVEAPEATVQVVDRSGREGTGAAYVARLVAMGVPEERLFLTEGSFDPAPSRLVVTAPHWSDADDYASLLGVGKQQIDRLPAVAGRAVGIRLVLGDDAGAPHPRPAGVRRG